MLDKIESETESNIENHLEDSETKYIREEPIPGNKEESHQLLTPETTVLDVDQPPAKRLQKKVAKLKWKPTSKSFILKVGISSNER